MTPFTRLAAVGIGAYAGYEAIADEASLNQYGLYALGAVAILAGGEISRKMSNHLQDRILHNEFPSEE